MQGTQRRKDERKFVSCGNCGHRLHRTAAMCTKCGYKRPFLFRLFGYEKINTRECPECHEIIPIEAPRRYSRDNRWDTLTRCPSCGVRLDTVLNMPGWVIWVFVILFAFFLTKVL